MPKKKGGKKPLKGIMQKFYDALAKNLTLKGKIPRSALVAEELAAAAASTEEDGEDEDYHDDGEEGRG